MQFFRLKGANDPEIQEMAEMVERQVQQLTRLVDDLVDVSRVGECGISLRIRTLDLKSVVAQAVETSRPLIESRRHVLTVSLPEYAVEVEGDLGRLTQVVSNLLNDRRHANRWSTRFGRLHSCSGRCDPQPTC